MCSKCLLHFSSRLCFVTKPEIELIPCTDIVSYFMLLLLVYFLSHIIMLIWILKVAGALTHDCSWSSIFLQGKVLTYSCQLPY